MIFKPTGAHTIPPVSQVAAGEIAEYTYDAANDLGAGQSVSNPSAELLDARTYVAVEDGVDLDVDTPDDDENKIAVRVTGIERGRSYELRIAFEHEPPRVAGEKTIRIHVIEGV